MTFIQGWKIFINALLAGLFIGMAGTVYLAVKNPHLGAFLFAFALMTILCYGFKLYTGAIGYLMTQKRKDILAYLVTLVLIWLGNLGGCFAVGSLVRCSRTFGKLDARAMAVCTEKLNDSPGSILILAFFCGILMYLAVCLFKEHKTPLGIFFCVPVFILSGYEHSIANMFYFGASGIVSLEAFAYIWVVILGNSIGGMLFPILKLPRKLGKK